MALVFLTGCSNDEKKTPLEWCVNEIQSEFEEPIMVLDVEELEHEEYSKNTVTKGYFITVATDDGYMYFYGCGIAYYPAFEETVWRATVKYSPDDIVAIDCDVLTIGVD
jgi:hypothetical protein